MSKIKQKYIALLKDSKNDMEKTSILTKEWDKMAIKHSIYTSVVKDLEKLESSWISVKDELPELPPKDCQGIRLIVSLDLNKSGKRMAKEIVYTSEGIWLMDSIMIESDRITHWMYFPETPN